MARMKVHELAKELQIQSRDICLALSEKGVELKPQSAISDEDAQYIRKRFGAAAPDAEVRPAKNGKKAGTEKDASTDARTASGSGKTTGKAAVKERTASAGKKAETKAEKTANLPVAGTEKTKTVGGADSAGAEKKPTGDGAASAVIKKTKTGGDDYAGDNSAEDKKTQTVGGDVTDSLQRDDLNTAGEPSERKEEETVAKPKTIITSRGVVRPAGANGGRRRPVGESPAGPDGVRRRLVGERPVGPDGVRRRPVGERPVGPDGVRRRPVGERPAGPDGVRRRPVGERPVGPDGVRRRPVGERPAGPDGMRRRPVGERLAGPNGERRRPVGERPIGPDGVRRRPVGERPIGPDGVRRRPVGEGPAGPDGERRRPAEEYGKVPDPDSGQGENSVIAGSGLSINEPVEGTAPSVNTKGQNGEDIRQAAEGIVSVPPAENKETEGKILIPSDEAQESAKTGVEKADAESPDSGANTAPVQGKVRGAADEKDHSDVNEPAVSDSNESSKFTEADNGKRRRLLNSSDIYARNFGTGSGEGVAQRRRVAYVSNPESRGGASGNARSRDRRQGDGRRGAQGNDRYVSRDRDFSAADRGSGDRRPGTSRGGDFRGRDQARPGTGGRSAAYSGGRYPSRGGDFKGTDRRSEGSRGDRRGDRRRPGALVGPSMPDRDKKARENRLRQEKQERGRRNYEDDVRGGRSARNMTLRRNMSKPQHKKEEKKEEIKMISLPESLTIGELAEKMKMQPSTVLKKLLLEGKIVTVNSEVDFQTAEEIAMGFGILCEEEEKVDVIGELLKEEEEDESLMVKRPPVVCVMGHVDHGKTSLLDAIKETNVTSQEAGGITQHIGAYVVEVNGEKITFLDTPGHEAFTAMRMRGAQSTDIAILVVAADDGVMPQTVEAINHAKAAGIEIIVAINKIDKPGANVDRVKQELAEYDLLAEDWGGSTVMVPISAHTKEGIDKLLEMVILQADLLELKANPDRLARGLIIEAKLDKGKGPVATVLVQKGTLRAGDNVAAGSHYGHVRAMVDDKGKPVTEALPSTPVKIIGLDGVPNAGEVLVAMPTGNEARNFAQTMIKESREKLLEGTKYRISLEDLNSQIEAGNLKELNLIIKADVQGSAEALRQSMLKLSNDEVEVKVIHSGVGAVTESDVTLASASNAIIIGFNVKPDNQAQDVADQEKVDIRLYNVIYNAIEDMESAMKGMLDPVFEEKILGHGEIRQIFRASGVGNIAGSYVLDGVFERGCKVRITRDNEQIFDGPLASLKRFKDDVKEVKAGFECGLVFEKFNDILEGDIIEAYKMVEVPR